MGDELAEGHGLEKIKTVGDAYMVVGGLPREAAADRAFGVDAAEHDVGVRHRRPRAARAVAGGAGDGARALRTHREEARGVHAGDGAAARADRRDLDHWRADHRAEVERGLGGQRGGP